MSYRNDKYDQGFRIYRDHNSTSHRSASPEQESMHEKLAAQQKAMEMALMRKLYKDTKIVGLLMYNKEVKGIRFYDGKNKKFIDIAPWQLHYFQVSRIQVMGVKQIELIRCEAGESEGTVLVEFLTKNEVAGIYRANRMVTNQIAQALSTVFDEMSEEEYSLIVSDIAKQK